MSSERGRAGLVVLGIYLTASAITAVVAGRIALKRLAAAQRREPASVAVPIVAPPAAPILAEAAVFRTTPATLAIEPSTARVRSAHPRSLRTFRFLRAYPGAPPRIPHGVTAEEFRTSACKECHQRGGYSLRFAAYVPVTPHPELGTCLQCHVGDESVMGFLIPGADPNTRCAQCHGPSGGRPRAEAAATWTTSVWPPVVGPTSDRRPPPIPHDLMFREDCVACHSGPGAVAEIRTLHADRTACRHCHVATDGEVGSFTRPAPRAGIAAGGPQ
jgi:cytochrome c-type protein NapB